MRVTPLQIFLTFLVLFLTGAFSLSDTLLNDDLTPINKTIIAPSPDGTCGPEANYTCNSSTFGQCCSSYDFCGNTTAHCLPSHGCQPLYGECSAESSNITTPSIDGLCGGSVTCSGGDWDGACCSKWGYCGFNDTYCLVENGCQKGLGRCKEISPDGTCGGVTDYICTGSNFGVCCSRQGFCGSTTAYCGLTCQEQAGKCLAPSPDGSCGWHVGYTCLGSNFGDCCSVHGWCGNTTEYCSVKAGCSTAGINGNYVGVCSEL